MARAAKQVKETKQVKTEEQVKQAQVKVSVRIKNMMKKVAAIQAQEAALKKQKDVLKDQVRDFMKENGLNEILNDQIKALYKEYESESFDTKLFQQERPKLYKQYIKVSQKERFEIKDAKAGK